jgi:hypothetical protein
MTLLCVDKLIIAACFEDGLVMLFLTTTHYAAMRLRVA